MKGVLDDEDRQSSDATKLYYNSGFASISITDPRKQWVKRQNVCPESLIFML